MTDLNAQARWWLTIWVGLLVFGFGDGGARLAAYVQRANQAFDHIVNDLDGATILMYFAERWVSLSPRMHRLRAPVGKDVTASWQAGGRVRDWVRFELARAVGRL